MNDKIVLICSVGRTGSTTLQRIINTIPNSNICGENNGAINDLLRFYKNIKDTTNKVEIEFRECTLKSDYNEILSKNIKPAWYNSYNYDKIVEQIRNTIILMFKDINTTNIWGFKEIRYDNGQIQLIQLFKELFPQTKIIIQIRENIVAQSVSGWFKNNNQEDVIKYLKKSNKELIDFYNLNKHFCCFITFERMFDLKQLYMVFKFLDCEQHFNEKKIINILSKTKE